MTINLIKNRKTSSINDRHVKWHVLHQDEVLEEEEVTLVLDNDLGDLPLSGLGFTPLLLVPLDFWIIFEI